VVRIESLNLRMVGGQLGEPQENAADNTIAADAHERKSIFSCCPHAGKQPAAQHRTATMQANLHVLLGKAESRSRLRSAQFFDVSKHDNGAELFGKAKHCIFKKLTEFRSGRILLRIQRSLDHIHRKFSILPGLLQLLGAVARAEPRQRFVDRNARQPGGKRCASGVLVQVLVGPDVSILHHIFRFGIIVQDRARDTIQALVVPAHDDLVQSRIAGFDPLDDLLVGPAFGLAFSRVAAVSMALSSIERRGVEWLQVAPYGLLTPSNRA